MDNPALKQYRILFADNRPPHLETRASFLEEMGYEVFRATNPEEARQILQTTYVHLAILDNHLVDDEDEFDKSGILIARDPQFTRIPKIIITRAPTWEFVREAMGGALTGGLPPAVDFIDKKFTLDEMLAVVERVLHEYVHINLSLQIQWDEQQPLSFPGLVGKIENHLLSRQLSERIEEMEDLFRKLFYTAEGVTITQLLWSRGGRAALEVLRFANGYEEPLLVTCGKIDEVLNESVLYQKFTPHGVHPGIIIPVEKAETVHYAATAWSFSTTGPKVEDLQSFTVYAATHPEKQIRLSLDNLFQTTLLPILQEGRFVVEGEDLTHLCCRHLGLTPENLSVTEMTRSLEGILQDALQHGLADASLVGEGILFRLPLGRSITLPNPIPLLRTPGRLPQVRAMRGTSWGGMDLDTLLVDRAGRVWLSEFGRLGLAPVWLDFAVLESTLRFRLADCTDLSALLELEKRFLDAAQLNDFIHLEDLDPDFRKLGGYFQIIRNQAAHTLGNDLLPYEISLLTVLTADITRCNAGQKRKGADTGAQIYRLLLAGLIAEKLSNLEPRNKGSQPVEIHDSPFSNALIIDETNHEVWVRGRKIALSPREFDLLFYLYRHNGELCRRSDLVREVFAINSPGHSDEESLLNTNIGRLRKKIEPDPKNPIYIETVRNIGFRFINQPE
jgi:DNA-binding response OmpR family regulator